MTYLGIFEPLHDVIKQQMMPKGYVIKESLLIIDTYKNKDSFLMIIRKMTNNIKYVTMLLWLNNLN